MVSKGKKDQAYQALQDLLREPGSHMDMFMELLREPSADSAVAPAFDDRAAAIVYVAHLEQALETALSSHFSITEEQSRRLFSYTDDGPLAEFAAKIAMGFALGIYGEKMQSDLRWAKNIRNAFAHTRVEVTFETPAIVLACDKLNFPKKDADEGYTPTSRQCFTAFVATATSLLLGRQSTGPVRLPENDLYKTIYAGTPPAE